MVKTVQAQTSLFGCREREEFKQENPQYSIWVTNFHSSIILLHVQINIECLQLQEVYDTKLTPQTQMFCYPDFVSVVAVCFNGVEDDEKNLDASFAFSSFADIFSIIS